MRLALEELTRRNTVGAKKDIVHQYLVITSESMYMHTELLIRLMEKAFFSCCPIVKTEWTQFVTEGGAVLAEPESYIILND